MVSSTLPTNAFSRRNFLRGSSTAAALGQTPNARLPSGAESRVAHMPENFVALSYENMQSDDPSFFSASNRSLVEQAALDGREAKLTNGEDLRPGGSGLTVPPYTAVLAIRKD